MFHLRKRIKNAKERGALSLELMGVIVVIATIMVSGLYYVSIMMRDAKVNNTISSLSLINTKIGEMYLNESSFNGITAAKFIKSGNAPSSMVASSTALKTTWGPLTVAAAELDSVADATYALGLEKLPSDVCQRLGSMMGNASSMWVKMKVGGGAEYEFGSGDSLVDYLSTNCANDVTMTLTARPQ